MCLDKAGQTGVAMPNVSNDSAKGKKKPKLIGSPKYLLTKQLEEQFAIGRN